jgi:hypothetical protein
MLVQPKRWVRMRAGGWKSQRPRDPMIKRESRTHSRTHSLHLSQNEDEREKQFEMTCICSAQMEKNSLGAARVRVDASCIMNPALEKVEIIWDVLCANFLDVKVELKTHIYVDEIRGKTYPPFSYKARSIHKFNIYW